MVAADWNHRHGQIAPGARLGFVKPLLWRGLTVALLLAIAPALSARKKSSHSKRPPQQTPRPEQIEAATRNPASLSQFTDVQTLMRLLSRETSRTRRSAS